MNVVVFFQQSSCCRENAGVSLVLLERSSVENKWERRTPLIWHYMIYLWYGPLPVTVTTRIITCLGSGIPINLHFPLLQGGGHIQDIPMSTPKKDLPLQKHGWANELLLA